MKYDIETKCLHLDTHENESDKTRAISFPIYQSATFGHLGLNKSSGYDYSRLQNPTREQVEKVVAELENGAGALAFSSGMAAIATVFELFYPGDHLIVDADLYGGSVRLLDHVATKNGIEISRVNLAQDSFEELITPNTKAVYFETPTNPMMNVIDIAAVTAIAKQHNLLVIVDNTFLSPYFQNPFDYGVDIIIHSGTKYLGGHNDTLAGFAVAKDEEILTRIQFLAKTTGGILAPFDAWLILRGIKTLALRMEKAQANAIELAQYLLTKKQVKKVIYPGLESHPGYQIIKKQARGIGAMISFELDSFETVAKVLENLQLIQYAESLGGVETLITYPVTQTHADVPEAILEANGITKKLLRLSVGIEAVKDLIADFDRVLD